MSRAKSVCYSSRIRRRFIEEFEMNKWLLSRLTDTQIYAITALLVLANIINIAETLLR